jgi:hypothetical protein
MKTSIRLLFLGVLFISLLPAPFVTHAQTSQSAFQAFEGGYMLWRGDTGEIWVLTSADWQVRHFLQAKYADLPDNPVANLPPEGLIKPVNGFGRVWENFADVRQALGWALAAETGYTAIFGSALPTAGGLQQTAVNFPDGREIVLREDQSWQFNDGQPRSIWSLNTPITFPITIQTFERGRMMWWSETGSIWVLNADNGQALFYDSLSYGALPDNPITESPPAGWVKPIMGFGKVWGHFPEVRQMLGWAVAPSQSYNVSFARHPANDVFACEINVPDLGTITIIGNAWQFTPSDGVVATLIPPGGSSPGGITTFTSPALHYAFEYPADWFIQVTQNAGHGYSETVTLTSYDPAGGEPAHAAFADPSLIKITFEAYSYADGWTFGAWVKQYKSRVDGVTLRILDEQTIALPGDIPALRLDMVSGTGEYPALVTVIDGTGMAVEGLMANSMPFDSVVSTLRAVQ